MRVDRARFRNIRGVLFDLDGTMADTAPDLAAAANAMRRARGMDTLPLADLRPHASQGARGLIGAALKTTPSDPGYEELRDEFLNRYERALCIESHLFHQIEALVHALAQRGLAWGIVTNKVERFTTPLVSFLKLVPGAATVVCGDTTPHAKPHPAPLLYAASQMRIAPPSCIYVGDDERDIEAGRAAGMTTVAAAYGYCADTDPHDWRADGLIHAPLDLLDLLET